MVSFYIVLAVVHPYYGCSFIITEFMLLGLNSPDTAIYESMKLFCSLLVTLVGKGLYGNNGGSTDVRFIDQGMLVSCYVANQFEHDTSF